MLTVHHSNRLEILADQLAERLRQPCGSPLLPEIIIVQSNGMARWLSLHLAQRLGICAHMRSPFPAAFIWELSHRLLSSVPETSPFAPDVLTWRIMALLDELEHSPQFASLHAYCEDGSEATRFALAARIAALFDQYLVYRPDWITQWEHGADEHWQAELWRRLVSSNAVHRVRLHEQLLTALQTAPAAQMRLPARVSLIGIPTLPPLHLEVFARLADCIDVHCFVLNPCRHNWSATNVTQERTPDVATNAAEALSGSIDNRLLASMGKLGRDFIDLVYMHQPQMAVQFAEPGEDTLLHCLQSDILHGRHRGAAGCPATPLQTNDCSPHVHVCHSRMREVEVLYDQLIRRFETFSTLQPADVLVMTPDIDAYAPLIEAVFTGRDRDRSLPFSIADRGPRAASPLVNGFFALLDLPGSRYAVNQLCALLELPAIQRRFALDAGDLPLVHRWLRETGVRWGIDHDSRAAVGLPAMREHTWRAGLERLLLGYALPGDHGQFFAELLPYQAVEGADAHVLGCLHTFTEAAFCLATTLREARSVEQWVRSFHDLLEQFLQPDEAEELDVQAIRSDFPRRNRSLSFDRMADAGRPGDRSRRDDDRYLFLEALLSARRCLYLSYVGRDIRDKCRVFWTFSAILPAILSASVWGSSWRRMKKLLRPASLLRSTRSPDIIYARRS